MLPPSAELKLLKFNQLRVNRRTEAASKEDEAAAGVQEELSKLTLYQKRLQGMTEEMVSRMTQGPVAPPEEEGEAEPAP